MTAKLRITYAVSFVLLLFIEISIALWVRDDFVRPYMGDVLVTVLLCCLVRILFVRKPRLLPVYVFIFSVLSEAAQYFDAVAWLGLADNRLLSTMMGRTFSWADLICYAVGCLLFFVFEKTAVRRIVFG